MTLKTNFLFDFYEKLYFHEIDVREGLGARLQIPMAIIVSLVGVLGFLIINSDKKVAFANWLFIGFLCLSATTLVVACILFVRSWFGYTYAFLPSSNDTEEYKELLYKTYRNEANASALVEGFTHDYLCKEFIKCATVNTACNDRRALNLHRTNGSLIIATVFVALCFLVFFLGDLDRIDKPTEVVIAKPVDIRLTKPTDVLVVKPLDIKGIVMTDRTTDSPGVSPAPAPPPPPHPPPPPTRLIREGVEIVKPQQDKKDGK